jgi:hypothetical protein
VKLPDDWKDGIRIDRVGAAALIKTPESGTRRASIFRIRFGVISGRLLYG